MHKLLARAAHPATLTHGIRGHTTWTPGIRGERDTMKNVTVKIDKAVMTITVKLDAPKSPSASGKTQVIASTQGNQSFSGPNGVVYVGLNVYSKE